MDRTILHCDLNAFFASVEMLARPELARVPMAVCGDPDSRHGIILAKNEHAKRYGVQTAETLWQAKKKCPELVLVPPSRGRYGHYSKTVNRIYGRFTDLVEPFGIDESWLDVTGSGELFGGGREIADRLRRDVFMETGLTISVGVSFCKVFSKLGSDMKKPDATTVITRDSFPQQVWPLPASALLFVGETVEKTLEKYGMKRIGDVAGAQRALLVRLLGKQGGRLWEYANGMDDSPVSPASEECELKSVSCGETFEVDIVTADEIRMRVSILCDTVGSRLRRYGLKCTTVKVQIRYPDFTTVSRQRTLDAPTYLTRRIADTAVGIILKSRDRARPIRMITVAAAGLMPESETGTQLLLPGMGAELDEQRAERVEKTLDGIRDRFGRESIGYGLPSKRAEREPEK